MRFISSGIIAASFLLASAAPAANSVILNALKDNTLYESSTGNISNGAGDYIFTGKTAQNVAHRAVIAFNMVGSVPPTAIITDVTLYLTVSRFAGGTHPVSLHALTRDWGEGTSNASSNEGQGTTASVNDATWVKAFNGNPGVLWTTRGGDFVAASDIDASFEGLNGVMTFTSPGMTDRARSWLQNPATNFGWILIGEESFTSTSVRFNSRTNPTTTSRPRLKVTYTCPADRDGNNVIDLFDYLDFVQAFSDNAASADFNSDQLIDFFDYLDYVRAFAGGC